VLWSMIFFIPFSFSMAASELDDTLKYFVETNELEKAREFLISFLESNPQSREALFYLGKIHFDGDSSLKYLSQAIDLTQRGEKSAEALLWMSKHSFLNASYSVTLEQTIEFRKRFKQSLFMPEILWLSGCSYLVSGYTDSAEQQFGRVLEEFPGSKWASWALLGLGDCFFFKKEFDQAIHQYSRLIDQYTDSDALPLSLISLCRSYIEIKDGDNALLYYNLYQDRFPPGILEQEKVIDRIRVELSEKIKKEKRERRKPDKYTIQVGLFSDKDQADREYRRFESRGYTSRILDVTQDGKTFWRVEVGIFDSQKNAESFKNKLEKTFRKTYKVISR